MNQTKTPNNSAKHNSIVAPEEIPSRKTVSAMLEAELIAKDTSVKGYHNIDELFSDLSK